MIEQPSSSVPPPEPSPRRSPSRPAQELRTALRRALKSALSELEPALSRLSEAQEESVRQARIEAFGSVAEGLAHDVNNALSSVLLRTTLLRRNVDPTAAEHIDVIDGAVLDAATTVQKLQAFARRRAGGAPATGAVDEALRAAADSVASRLGPTEIALRLQSGATVQAPLDELRETFYELLKNAHEATGGTGPIEIDSRASDGMVTVVVSDRGPGIPAESLPRLFEPFFTTRGPGSSGLGLAMVYGLARRLGGDLRAENRDGGGARIALRLPAAS